MGITFVRRSFDLSAAYVLYNYRHVDIEHASIGWGLSKRDKICEHPILRISFLIFDHVRIRYVFRKPINHVKSRDGYP